MGSREQRVHKSDDGVTWKLLREFLYYFLNQHHPGLLVVQDRIYDEVIQKLRKSLNFSLVHTAREFHRALQNAEHILISFDYGSESALVSDFKQCSARFGALDTRDPRTLETIKIEFHPSRTKLLAITPGSRFGMIKERFSILDYVGLVEHI